MSMPERKPFEILALNKSKGEMAYTLVDVDSAATRDLVAQLGRIGGVLAVRYLPLRD